MEWDERADGADRDWSIDRFLSDTDQLQKENIALRAEVERLRDCLLKVGFAVAVYDDSSDRARSDYDMMCAGGTLADAVRVMCDEFLPQPPENG